MGNFEEKAIEQNERDFAEGYMKEWADWMDAPLGKPITPTQVLADQAHLDSIKAEK